jgi:hypothetical protein
LNKFFEQADRQTDRHAANESGEDEEEHEEVEYLCEEEWGVLQQDKNNEHLTRGLNSMNSNIAPFARQT